MLLDTGFCDINYNETPGLADSFQLYGDMDIGGAGVSISKVGADAEVLTFFRLISGLVQDYQYLL